jgi:ATP-dependent Clp protease adaptor protein ClpS
VLRTSSAIEHNAAAQEECCFLCQAKRCVLTQNKTWVVKNVSLESVALSIDFIRMSFMGIRKQDESVLEAKRTRTKPPPLYKVLLLNDDYTPMDFVIAVLQKYFGMDRERATRVMLQVHREGMGVCGVFPRDIATTKVEQVASFARQHQHPLACVMEEN